MELDRGPAGGAAGYRGQAAVGRRNKGQEASLGGAAGSRWQAAGGRWQAASETTEAREQQRRGQVMYARQ